MLYSISFSLAFVLLSACHVFGQQDLLEEEVKILDRILDKSRYDPRIRAQTKVNSTSGPALINATIYLRTIEHICPKKMEWKVQITFRQQWNDGRLEFDDLKGEIKYLTIKDIKSVWTPDTFFRNSRSEETHDAINPNTLMRIYPNGNIYFSKRLTLTLSCPMHFESYPFDRQICPIQLASYGYTTENVAYEWNENGFEMAKNLYLPGMTFEEFSTDNCTAETKSGVYACLSANFRFKRELSGYLCKWFVPTAIITLVSFVSFWLRHDKSARIKTLVISLSILYLHILMIKYKSPNVSYSTPMDCWTSTCLLFIIGAFIEFAIVKCMAGRKSCHNKKTDLSNECNKSNGKNCEEGDAVALKPLVDDGHDNNIEEGVKEYTVNDTTNRRNYLQKWKRAPITCRIDSIAGIVFPLLFILYIITFFGYELSKAS